MKIEICQHKTYKNSYVAICTLPSAKRTIVVDGTPYRLQFPEMKFFIEVGCLNNKYHFQSLRVTDKTGHLLSLPHQANDGLVCLEDGYSYHISRIDIKELCEEVVNYFWQSEFLYHFNDCNFGSFQFRKDLEEGSISALDRKSWIASLVHLENYKLVRKC